MQQRQSVDFHPLVSHEQAVNAFQKGLGLFVGRGRRMSVAQLAKAAGVHHRTIEAFKGYRIGHPDWRSLDWGQMLSISAVLGADFTNEWLPLAGQGAFDLPEDEPSPGDLAAEVAEDAAALMRATNGGAANLAHIGNRLGRNARAVTAMAARAA